MGKQGKGGGDRGVGSHLLLLGIVLYVVSWFVPVVRGQEIFGGLGNIAGRFGSAPSALGASGPDWLPGWTACDFAWHLLIEAKTPGTGEEWKQRVVGSTCLTNLVMLVAIVCTLAKRRSVLLGLCVLLAAGVNASWLYLGDTNPFESYAAGYYLWLASFVLVGMGLLTSKQT